MKRPVKCSHNIPIRDCPEHWQEFEDFTNPPTPTIEEQLDEIFKKYAKWSYSNGKRGSGNETHFYEMRNLGELKTELSLLITKAEQNVLDTIAQGEGWEDSRDFYAAKLGISSKYTNRFHDGTVKATTQDKRLKIALSSGENKTVFKREIS